MTTLTQGKDIFGGVLTNRQIEELGRIRDKMNLSNLSQVVNAAVDEFITKYAEPKPVTPSTKTEPVLNTERWLREQAAMRGATLTTVCHEFVTLPMADAIMKYGIDSRTYDSTVQIARTFRDGCFGEI